MAIVCIFVAKAGVDNQMSRSYDLIASGRQDCSNMHSWGPGMRSSYVVHYIIKGSGTFIKKGISYSINSGQSFVIRPFENICYFPDRNSPWEYIWADFAGDQYSSLLSKINYLKGDCVIDNINSESILPFYNMLNQTDLRSADINKARGLLLTILGIYADTFPHRNTDLEYNYFNGACGLIQKDFYKTDFGISAICDSLGISRSTLHRCFVKACGVSPGAYLINYRIARSKEMLEHGLTVKSTALSSGFRDAMYFSKFFKATLGVAPSEYRRGFINKR